MAESLTIARPYAKAVFEQALTAGKLAEWHQILQALATVANDPNVAALLDNPLVNHQQLLTLFTQVTAKICPQAPAALHKELKNFLTVLIQEKRLGFLPEILRGFQRRLSAEEGLKEVTVISAFPLDTVRRNSMTEALARYLKSKVTVDFQDDASLIGGVMVRCGNWVMDGSIKGKLQNLRDNLQA